MSNSEASFTDLDNLLEDPTPQLLSNIVDESLVDVCGESQPTEQAKRYNEGKPQWSLVHYKSLEPMVKVLEFGCTKYDRDNWKKGMPLNKILESMQRHLAALMDGEEFDSESGISHIGHIQANAMFYNYHTKNGEIESEI